jgi:hypothetical protein
MGRLIARGGVLALVLAVGITLAVPMTSAVGQRTRQPAQSHAVSATLVKATSWAFLSVAQSSKHDAFAVGYSRAPSTAPIGLHWDGSSWVVTPMPHPAGGAVLYSTTAIPGTKDYFAGGESCTNVACPEAYILKWDGSSWAQMALPPLIAMTDVASVSASSANDAWAVGQSCTTFKCNVLLLHWNGAKWSRVTIPNLSSIFPDLFAVADLSPTDAWAVGNSFLGSLALNWNGHSWVNVPVSGNGGFTQGINAVAAIPGTSEIWALEAASGGQFMLKWNGTGWRGFPLPSLGRQSFYNVSDVAASSTSNAWDVGYSFSKSGTQPSLTIHWKGNKWSAVASPSPDPANELFGVTTSSDSSAFAVGVGFSPFQPTAAGLLLQWNGTSWTRVKVPTPMVPGTATPRASRLGEGRKF